MSDLREGGMALVVTWAPDSNAGERVETLQFIGTTIGRNKKTGKTYFARDWWEVRDMAGDVGVLRAIWLIPLPDDDDKKKFDTEEIKDIADAIQKDLEKALGYV